MNERTHFFIKIYLSHFILERVDVSCVWEVSWRRGQTVTYWPKVLLTIAALLSHSGWAAQPQALSLQADSHAGIWPPNWLQLQLELTDWPKLSVAPGYIIVWHPPASCGRMHLPPSPNSTTSTDKVIFRYLRSDAPVSLFFRLFTQVHLLIHGSVEGQYVTILPVV